MAMAKIKLRSREHLSFSAVNLFALSPRWQPLFHLKFVWPAQGCLRFQCPPSVPTARPSDYSASNWSILGEFKFLVQGATFYKRSSSLHSSFGRSSPTYFVALARLAPGSSANCQCASLCTWVRGSETTEINRLSLWRPLWSFPSGLFKLYLEGTTSSLPFHYFEAIVATIACSNTKLCQSNLSRFWKGLLTHSDSFHQPHLCLGKDTGWELVSLPFMTFLNQI